MLAYVEMQTEKENDLKYRQTYKSTNIRLYEHQNNKVINNDK